MKHIIRWPGLIAFVVVMGLIIGGSWLFANTLVKSLIESQGTALVGAKVDVGDVQLSLIPAGIVISRLDVANADKPMQNVVSIAHISAQFDLLKALMGQLIIDDASVEGIQFGTARRTSGAVVKKVSPPEPPAEPSFVSEQLASLKSELPDSKELLAREPLMLDQRSEALEKNYQEKKAVWDQLQNQLPDNSKINNYEQRLKAITDSKIKSLADFQQKETELKQLKKDIKADRDLIKQARDHLQLSQQQFSEQLGALKDAPAEDRDRILSKYTFDESGLVNMSGLLFGEQIHQYLETALSWYQKVEPYLASEEKAETVRHERAEGRFVRFAENNPMPDFLIKNMAASAVLPAGKVSVALNNITHQQAVINRPTTLVAMSEVLNNLKRLDVNAVFDYRQKDNGHSTADFKLDDLLINNFKVVGGSDFPLVLESASSDMQGQLQLVDGSLHGTLHGSFSQTQFRAQADSGLLKRLAQAFAGIDQFSLDVTLGGSLRKPDIHISSDIDKLLKASMEQQLKEEIAAFRQQLEQELGEQLNKALKKVDIDGFADSEQSLDDKLKNLDNMLEAKLDDYVDQQKDEAKDKAKDKLKGKLKGLF